MFTTLTVINERNRKRFLSEESSYKDYTFYTTRLFSKKSDNQKRIRKFASRAAMPIITDNCAIIKQYEFITLANTVLSDYHPKSIGIYDTAGVLPFLLPFLSEKSGIICIFTNNPDAYTKTCEQIYRLSGTPTCVTDKLGGIFTTDLIFSAENMPIEPECRVIRPENKTDICLPDTLNLPEHCNPFLVCAGLFFYGGFREFGRIKLKEGS